MSNFDPDFNVLKTNRRRVAGWPQGEDYGKAVRTQRSSELLTYNL
jgi:hypothetical protein